MSVHPINPLVLKKEISDWLLAYNHFGRSVKKNNAIVYDTHRYDKMDIRELYLSRFQRLVELFCNQVAKGIELWEYGASEGTMRDRLNTMVKMKIIHDTHIWIELRNMRNRIAHFYLADDIEETVLLVHTVYEPIMESLSHQLTAYHDRIS